MDRNVDARAPPLRAADTPEPGHPGALPSPGRTVSLSRLAGQEGYFSSSPIATSKMSGCARRAASTAWPENFLASYWQTATQGKRLPTILNMASKSSISRSDVNESRTEAISPTTRMTVALRSTADQNTFSKWSSASRADDPGAAAIVSKPEAMAASTSMPGMSSNASM